MSDFLHASSRVLVREKIPGSAVDGMVEFLEKYYLTPALHASRIDSYSKRGPGAERNFEVSWRTGGPTAAGVPRPEQTYLSFITLVKWAMGIIILIVVGMAYFLV